MITPQDQTFSYHYDGTGNTIAITDQTKNIQNTYGYTPFGVITENEVFDQPFTFSGEYGVIQEPNGFYYMRARYYDPIIGRFISEDPIRFAGGDVNLYAYAGNNPVNFVDPRGLSSEGIDPQELWYTNLNDLARNALGPHIVGPMLTFSISPPRLPGICRSSNVPEEQAIFCQELCVDFLVEGDMKGWRKCFEECMARRN